VSVGHTVAHHLALCSSRQLGSEDSPKALHDAVLEILFDHRDPQQGFWRQCRTSQPFLAVRNLRAERAAGLGAKGLGWLVT
jgi:hypothetical protein